MAVTAHGLDERDGAAFSLRAWLAARLEGERGRGFLWVPVALGAGAGGYFVLPSEPAAWIGPLALVAGIAAMALGRRQLALLVAGAGVAALALGFAAAAWRTQSVAAPVLQQRWGPADLTGRVVAVEHRPEGRRVVLDRLAMPGLADPQTPERIRLTLREREPPLRPGERIRLRARVLPPPPPAAPGAFDFQHFAWFQQLGGVGQGLSRPVSVAPAESGGIGLAITDARQAVVERTLAVLPGASGTIAAALMTGEQGAIPPDTITAMRDSGLAHILSISGLHISLVAAFVFLVVRRGLALTPAALTLPIKKLAAAVALAAITFYTAFAAPGVPTQRAWLMGLIALGAIMIDRLAITMRLVAWAAIVLVLAFPESLLGASFQMSFAAVVALVAAWEALRDRLAAWRADAGMLRRALIVVAAGAMTSLVAGTASAPFALYHFNRFSAYGLVANLLAMPLAGLWIMPWMVIAFVLLPLGLEGWALVPMGWGIDAMIAVAHMVADWPGAVALLPAMPWWGLAVLSLGGLWLCLWRGSWRWWGVPVAALGLATALLERGPDVLVAGDGTLAAVRGADGQLQFSSARGASIARATWLRRDGQAVGVVWPTEGESADGRLACDPTGCVYRVGVHTVALARRLEALEDDCRDATVLVALVPVRRACPGPRFVIDRRALERDGGHAIRLDADGAVRIESVRGTRGERPWVPPALRRAAPPPPTPQDDDD